MRSFIFKNFWAEKVIGRQQLRFFSPEKVIEVKVNSKKKKIKLALRSFAFRKKKVELASHVFSVAEGHENSCDGVTWRPILFRHEKLPGDRFFFAGKSYWLRKTQADIFSPRKVIGGAKDGGRFSPRKVIGCAVDGGLFSSAEKKIYIGCAKDGGQFVRREKFSAAQRPRADFFLVEKKFGCARTRGRFLVAAKNDRLRERRKPIFVLVSVGGRDRLSAAQENGG